MSEECDRTELRLDNERPNSGLREGEISHVGVNDALRVHLKMVIFGQQTRLRGRVLLEDEKLVRFHAGHDLVRFFYGGVRQLPEVLKLADLAGMADLKQLDFEVENALRYSNDEGLLKGLADIFYDHYLQLDRVEADFNTYLLGQILKKLDLHPRYREVFVPQYEHLVGGRELVVSEDLRPQVDELAEFIPDKALRLSSDPQRLRLCLQCFEELRRSNPGSAELLELLAGIFLRLDRSDKYRELLAVVKDLGEVADRVGAEIVAQIGAKDPVRADILSAVQDLLQEQERLGVRRAEYKEWEWPSLVESLYRLLGMEGVEERGQPLHLYLHQDQVDNKDVLRGLVEHGSEIPLAHRAIITLLFTGK